MTTTGTNHFVSFSAARRYYRWQFEGKGLGKFIQGKIDREEIHIGAPKLVKGETLAVDKNEGRYFIKEG